MKIVLRTVILLSFSIWSDIIHAQDTLPDFTVINRNGRVILSWVNNFPVIKQLSIQRSSDSLKGFKTILTLPDPSSVTNGFLDNNAPNISSFYKLYILLGDGQYIFSKSHKPQKDLPPMVKPEAVKPAPKAATEENKRSVSVSAQGEATDNNATARSASKSYQLATTNTSTNKRSDGFKTDKSSISRPETFTPSGFVFANPDGNITIVLPSGRHDNFKIKFYEENGDPLFQINNIKEYIFTLDKSNFMHAGWFNFELFENGILKERNKVRVPKDTTNR